MKIKVMNMKKSKISYLVLSDIHLGHNINTTENIINNLQLYFKDNYKEFSKLDMICIAGDVFDKLTVIEKTDERDNQGNVFWLCKCECGNNNVKVRGFALTSGKIKSCGCMRKQRAKKMGLNNRRDFGCMNCGSDKHYAKGYCHNCYEKYRRGTL